MKSKIIFLTICLFFLFTNTALAAPNISSPSAILIDSKSGQILYGKDIDAKHYPASITKVMTALLLLEDGDLDKVVTIKDDVPNLIERGSSQIYLIPGEKITREQLLYALLIDSANDAAVAIAQDVSGSVDKFADKMNEKAKGLGMKNTHFVNPHGLHDENHYTTAKDMSIVAKEAMKNPLFRKIVTTERYIIPATNKQDTRYLYIGNRLIRNTTYKNYHYEGATGIKTGWTSEANFTLIGGAEKDGRDLITVIMDSNGVDVYMDTHTLLDYGFEGFQSKDAFKKGEIIKEIPFDKTKETLPLIAENTFEYSFPKDTVGDITTTFELPEDIDLPIKKGDIVGDVVLNLDGKEIGKINLIADKSIEAPNKFLSIFTGSSSVLKWAGILISAFLVFRTFIYISKQKRRRRRRMFGGNMGHKIHRY
ncbi:D-alanyl-D-alanine carboxypeptidase [Irregularibacter muris]|uniref:serine-type D-Ala-D-Ala carboxypeptidase n=1 Tax=Irregularibacter muris TaxID=1796619 RepID=A0AAE3HGL4_9FIRM|nr:D-alanyl-D-alanine carboxypeptidase family protein [Irregularibacter muris]MCR1900237.1 D-alanyl-D-alanine carboxypeptidase [Irregularibacter muris]